MVPYKEEPALVFSLTRLKVFWITLEGQKHLGVDGTDVTVLTYCGRRDWIAVENVLVREDYLFLENRKFVKKTRRKYGSEKSALIWFLSLL